MSTIAGYTKDRQGDATLFRVTPAPYPKFRALLASGALLLLAALATGSSLGVILAAACLWFGYADPRPPEHKEPSSFRVRPGAIESSAGQFTKGDVEQLTVRTGYESRNPLERVGAAVGQLQKVEVEQATAYLVLRSRGVEHILAGGLDPKTAQSLLADVNDAFGDAEPHTLSPAGDTLFLSPHLKAPLQELCGILRDAARRGVSFPTPMLLYGPPGTGKTAIARLIAREATVPFLPVHSFDLKGSFSGQSAESTRRLFEKARAMSPVMLFIDELDAIGATRGSADSDRFTEEIVTELLAHMDGAATSGRPLFILAAALRPDSLDPALLHRFARRIEIPLPNENDRREILKRVLGTKPLDGDIDIDDLAAAVAHTTSGCSGRDLVHLVDRAMEQAVARAASVNDIRLTRAQVMEQAEALSRQFRA